MPLSPLTLYVRFWAVSVVCRVVSRAGAELLYLLRRISILRMCSLRIWVLFAVITLLVMVDMRVDGSRYNEAVAVCACLAFILPQHPAVLLMSLGCRMIAVLASMPYVHDSQYWCLQTDLALTVSVVIVVRHRSRSLASLNHKEAEAVAAGLAPIVRGQLILFYSAAALFKANEGFLTPYFSCAPIYLVQLMEQNIPAGLLTPSIIWLATQSAPAIILATEALIPLLLWLQPRYGVAFASLFHWAIAITPPPNDIASFGVQTLPRLLLLIPDLPAVAASIDTVFEPSTLSAAVALVASLTCALQPITWVEFDCNVPVCGAMAATVLLGLVKVRSTPDQHEVTASRYISTWVLWLLAGVYAMLALPLGLMDMGAPNMFSSLRVHGGSNHVLLPMNILQRVYIDAPATTLAGEIFGGGVIRVEGVNSSHLTGSGVRYPGELVSSSGDGCCQPAAVQLLRSAGHSGRQWSPMSFSCAVGNRPPSAKTANASIISSTGQWKFQPYTIPAAELRRLIRQARVRYPGETFYISGAILPGAEGDENWRATATSARFVIRRRYDTSGSEQIECVQDDTKACQGWVADRLLATPSGHWLARLASKLLLQQPYPLVQGDEGDHRRVHCFGP
jgi:hypothetical protein